MFKTTIAIMITLMIAAVTTIVVWNTTESDSCAKPKYNRTSQLCHDFNSNNMKVSNVAYPIWDRTRR